MSGSTFGNLSPRQTRVLSTLPYWTTADLAQRYCILRTVVGSTLHGLGVGADDRDEMGVCIEPEDFVVGLQHFEQWTHRTQPEGVRSGPGDLDVTIYSLRKWCRLALQGNPTILLLLFAPQAFQVVQSEYGEALQALAPSFIAKTVAKPFLGYMTAQRQRLVGERGQKRIRRDDLVEKYGYDTKYAMHMLRLGFQGVELLKTGRLCLPLEGDPRDYLIAVRAGNVPLQDVLTRAGELEREVKDLEETSPLPGTPDRDGVNVFLVETYTAVWEKEQIKKTNPSKGE